MKYWFRHWSRWWEPPQREEKPRETPELASGRERLPPGMAQQVMRQPEVSTGGSLRQRAGQALQNLFGNRWLAASEAGRPLPPAMRARLEASLGIDLTTVRLHHDEASTQALNARAFVAGDQIVLSRTTDANDEALIGHEAAHVSQARQQGIGEGISKPGSASEHKARTAAHGLQSGRPVALAQSGGPVPAVQRQEQRSRAPAPTDPLVRRESVRIMLLLQHQQQGGQGPLSLTPELQNELRRLIPELTVAAMARLWTPEPGGPAEAFQRLLDAGYLPLITLPPEPELVPPTPGLEPEPEPESAVSPTGMGMVGFHYRLNPRVPTPIAATIRQHLTGRGFPLNYRQIEALLAGREQGVEQIKLILRAVAPSLGEEDRTSLAETIADALLDTSLRGQLEREAPTPVEQFERRTEALAAAQGPVPDLLQRLPVGASITIYF
jgi:hypothetical protein